ncbi:MAG: GspMb/PilO family protein [Roseimicrobium sp.]
MKGSEQRLLMIFLVLVAILGGFLLAEQLNAWQGRLDRREHEAELLQVEHATRMAQAPEWTAKAAWLSQAQPVANSEQEASLALIETLQAAAKATGLDVTKTVIDPVEKSDYYRQFGVLLTVKGDFKPVMQWLHGTLSPQNFYVVPRLRITPDKEDPTKVTAELRFWRWYSPEFASVTSPGAAAPEASSPPPQPQPTN